ncbi:MAG: AAA family ATPase [Gammaproteobacteria bacterium]|nr:AAA family ATPase [Gammaproteobacteria bacterium]
MRPGTNQVKSIVVINSKGGAGKTTLSTNLAGYYAGHGRVTALKDYDPQASSLDWLNHRPHTREPIYGVNAAKTTGVSTRSWQMRIPPNVEQLIVDCPAGVDLQRMEHELCTANAILIPVMPSPVDIRAAAMFIYNLNKFLGKYRCKGKVAAVASRVTAKCSAYTALVRIFDNLEIPLVASLKESDNYIHAAEHGLSIMEMDGESAREDQKYMLPLIAWLEGAHLPTRDGVRSQLFAVGGYPKNI